MRLPLLILSAFLLFSGISVSAQKQIRAKTTKVHLVDRTAVGEETATTEYFTVEGNKERVVSSTIDGANKEEWKYIFDEKGNWIVMRKRGIKSTIKRTLEYDDRDSIIKESIRDQAYSTEYKYDESGKLSQRILKYKLANSTQTIDYTYDGEKLIKQQGTLVNHDTGESTDGLSYTYTYNSAKQLTKLEVTNPQASADMKRTTINEYKYDNQGRVITEIEVIQVFISERPPAVSYFRIEYGYGPEGYPTRKSYYTEERRLQKYDEIAYTFYE